MVVNYDESWVCATDTDDVVYERCDKLKANLLGSRNQSLCSLLTFICADRTVLLTIYFFPSKPADDDGEVKANIPFTEDRYLLRGMHPVLCAVQRQDSPTRSYREILRQNATRWPRRA